MDCAQLSRPVTPAVFAAGAFPSPSALSRPHLVFNTGQLGQALSPANKAEPRSAARFWLPPSLHVWRFEKVTGRAPRELEIQLSNR
jgi:hypothetical protein